MIDAPQTVAGRKIRGPKDMEGRKCTDCCCCCLFLFFWIGLAAIATLVISTGSIAHVVYGTDYMGNRCGTGELADKTKVWFPRIAQDVYEQSVVLNGGSPADVSLYGICVEACPAEPGSRKITDYGHGSSKKASSWPVDMPTSSMLNRCMPRQRSTESDLTLCTSPKCGEARRPCVPEGGFGVPSGSWQLGKEDEHLCRAQIVLERTATVKQPGAGPFLTYLFQASNMIEDIYETILDNWVKILSFGIGLSTAVNFVWMIFLFFFAGAPTVPP